MSELTGLWNQIINPLRVSRGPYHLKKYCPKPEKITGIDFLYNLKDTLEKNFVISFLKASKYYSSNDGTKKWLFKLNDGKEIETVLFPKEKGVLYVYLLR